MHVHTHTTEGNLIQLSTLSYKSGNGERAEFYAPRFRERGQQPSLVLVYPKFADTVERAINVPINLLYLGTYLKDRGVAVTLLDALWHDNFEERVLEAARTASAVGISAMTFQLPHALDIVRTLKREFPQLPILVGGVHPTLFAEQVIQEPLVDFVVKGEGEIPILRILDVLMGNVDREILKSAPGLAFRDKIGRIHISPEFAELVNYRDYPEVDYSLLDPEVLDGYKESETLYFPLVTSRGCPYRCTFCINVVVPNTRFRDWTPERVVREFGRVQEILGYKNRRFWIWDEIYMLNKKRNREVAELILKEGLDVEYTSSARADFFKAGFLDVPTLKLLHKSGMHRVSIGVESGSQKILDYLQKDLPRDMILQSAEYCREANIRPSYSFMIGLPPENKEDVLDTVKVIRELSDRLNSWSVVGPQIFRPYPGSTILPDCEQGGWEMPATNEAWIHFVQDEKYSPDAKDLPWVKNPGLVNTVYFYTALVALRPKKLVAMFAEFCQMVGKGPLYKFAGAAAVLALSALGKLRIKLDFYGLFFERALFGQVRRKYISF